MTVARPPIGSLDRELEGRRHRQRDRRRILFTIRLTDDEAERLAMAAQDAGLAVSDLARERLFGPGSGASPRAIALLERIAKRVGA